jgi:hypothetical protein
MVSQLFAASIILYCVVKHPAPHVSAQDIVILVDPVTHVDQFGIIVVVGAVLSCVLVVLVLQFVVFHKLSLLLTK